jgi:hypothetical protein
MCFLSVWVLFVFDADEQPFTGRKPSYASPPLMFISPRKMTVRGGVAPAERPVYSSSSPDQPQAPAGRHGLGFHQTGVGLGPCRSAGAAKPIRARAAQKPPNGKRMDQAGVERATGPSCRATSPAERSGADWGKRSPLAKRVPHPFRPAGRRTVRASGPCHPFLRDRNEPPPRRPGKTKVHFLCKKPSVAVTI